MLNAMYPFKFKSNSVDETTLPKLFGVIPKNNIFTACAGVTSFLGKSLKYFNSCSGTYFLVSFCSLCIFNAFLIHNTDTNIAITYATTVIIIFIMSLLSLFAFASFAHTVSSSITSFNISKFLVLSDDIIISVGKSVLISIYLPELNPFKLNCIVSKSVTYISPFKSSVCPHTFILSLLTAFCGNVIVPETVLASTSKSAPTNCQYSSA